MPDSPAPAVWEDRPAWSKFRFIWLFAFIAALRAVVRLWLGETESVLIYTTGAILLVAMVLFLRNGIHYRLTRDGVYTTLGIRNRIELSIPIGNIRTVDIEQDPMDRFFGIGTLVLHLKDEETRKERIKGIKNPEIVYNKIKALL
jgi:membrane protein YdbS with pleckstrin-like domain